MSFTMVLFFIELFLSIFKQCCQPGKDGYGSNVFYIEDYKPVMSKWDYHTNVKKKLHNIATIVSVRNGWNVPFIQSYGHYFIVTKKA